MDTSTSTSPRKRSARISKESPLTEAVEDYDRGRDAVRLSNEMPQNVKVQLLHLLIAVGAIGYASLVDSEVPVKVLALFKVFPVILMILMAHALSNRRSYGMRVAFGLALCAIGNTCFELEGLAPAHVPLFLIGLGFFLAGLCAFSYAFSANAISLSAATSALPVVYAAVVFNLFRPTMPAELRPPVFAFAAIIAALLLLAFSRQPEGLSPLSSWRFASAGAVLFTATSTILGYDRFVGAVPHAKRIFMVTYYLALYLITMSTKGAQARQLSRALGSVENFQKGQNFRHEIS